ncbi:SAM-dependent methyltransferase [Saccharothrix coeruleofusca]|uniref:class I SAM-dependent DNA methyltransferase n=1 Tax=Saccharothrix coeruleofusca TaxID=33919 RepID=UPI001AE17D83|nr:class I SAM-dependent methyltransferase [Saccharothrix coeruleofusca]MBP2340149.1 SAM-dependent methyltransferase [Saccharothrix coeruleofusca]
MHLSDDEVEHIVRRTRRTYDQYAEEYVTTTGRLEQFPGLDRELDRFFDALPSGLVLELGCGAGRDVEHLIRRGAAVIAGDLSERLLRVTRARCATSAAVQLNLLSLPFAATTFAGVWACASVLHVPRSRHVQAFLEMHRVLIPGGVVAISLKEGDAEDWMHGGRLPSPRWFSLRTPDSVVSELESVGFRCTRVLPSGRGAWFVVEAVRA